MAEGAALDRGNTLSHARVLKIAFPVVLSSATVPILGAVDTGVVGQLGLAAPIGAVGIGAIILSAFYWMFGFLRMGTAGLTSQAIGAGDKAEVSALLMRVLMIGGTAGLAIILLQIPLFWMAFQFSPASAEVETMARSYMHIRIWSAPAAIAIYGITGWLVAQERTRAVFVVQFWMNGLNVVLDLWFVLGLGWGIEGVAIATLLAETSGTLLGLWLCRNGLLGGAWRDWARVFDADALRHMASVNSDILLRSLMLQGIFVSFLFLGARFGDVKLAANQVLLQFLEITAYSMGGFALAAETLVGQALGGKARMRLRQAALLTSFWGAVVAILMAFVFAVWGGDIIDIMTTSPEVRSEARLYLPYMVLSPLVGLGAWMLDGIFVGATRGRDMRNMMFLSLVVYLLALLALIPFFGNHGLWMALLISFIARGVTLGMRYPALEALAD